MEEYKDDYYGTEPLKLHPECKIHKIKMELNGFERGYRLWSCPKCLELSLTKDKRKLKKKIEVSY